MAINPRPSLPLHRSNPHPLHTLVPHRQNLVLHLAVDASGLGFADEVPADRQHVHRLVCGKKARMDLRSVEEARPASAGMVSLDTAVGAVSRILQHTLPLLVPPILQKARNTPPRFRILGLRQQGLRAPSLVVRVLGCERLAPEERPDEAGLLFGYVLVVPFAAVAELFGEGGGRGGGLSGSDAVLAGLISAGLVGLGEEAGGAGGEAGYVDGGAGAELGELLFHAVRLLVDAVCRLL